MSVYGDLPSEIARETDQQMPKSFYGVGKIASEKYLEIYRKYDIQTVSLRLFNVYGPGQNLDNLRQGMVSIFLAQAIESRNVIVKGSKNRFRDFVFIDDVVEAFIIADKYSSLNSGTFNIGTGKKTRVSELISMLSSRLPYKVSCDYVGNTPGDQHGIIADISKAKNELGWVPKIGLDEGLSLMIAWALTKNK